MALNLCIYSCTYPGFLSLSLSLKSQLTCTCYTSFSMTLNSPIKMPRAYFLFIPVGFGRKSHLIANENQYERKIEKLNSLYGH